MTGEPDPARLRALEARIERLKEVPKAQVATRPVSGFSQGEMAWRMVIELCTGMVLGMAIGYGLDYLFGTLPVLLIVFSLFGFAAGVKTMLGTAKDMARTNAASAATKED